MKLASLKHGRDGRLVIVSRDLTRAVDATDIAPTLQAALDDWDALAPALQNRSSRLNAGEIDAGREIACIKRGGVDAGFLLRINQ